MGSSIAFYCGNRDTDAIQNFARSIGLGIVAPLVGDPLVSAEAGPFCYLAPAGLDLHPYGSPPAKISDATDPLISFMRAYYKYPYLVLGHIQWSDDVPRLASQTKSHYQKLGRWIRKEWKEHGDFYLGPEAQSLADGGAQLVNVLPAQATMHIVKVGS